MALNGTVPRLPDSGTPVAISASNGVWVVRSGSGVTKVTGNKEAPNGSTPNTPVYDRRVSFVGLVDQLPQVYVMNGDGSRPQQLTEWEADYPYIGLAPNWVPTG